jgi:hypothetical protein
VATPAFPAGRGCPSGRRVPGRAAHPGPPLTPVRRSSRSAALTLTANDSATPLAVRLDSFVGQYPVNWQRLFGASLVVTIPVVILFAPIERRVVGGLTAGSIR